MGYVGLPLAREAVLAGLEVTGLDASASVVSGLMQSRSHVDDVSDAEVASMLRAGFRVTEDAACLAEANVIVICVPTPLGEDGGPDLAAVRAAATATARHLAQGQLVVLESTTYPGTTEEVLVPILEGSGLRAGEDFSVAFSPERVDPGNTAFGVRNTPKVIGGLTPKCTERAADFYRRVVDEVVIAKGPKEAELTKLLENTYRHVNIALMNEMLRFSHQLDIDLWDAIRCAATKPFGYQPFYPGPGVGGHCIPIDPNYLSHRVQTHLGQPFRFIELAQEVNDAMPGYVARRAQDVLNEHGKAVKGSSIVLLGVTYKADIADQRESPARAVAKALRRLGAHLAYVDPYVGTWQVHGVEVERSTLDALEASDLVILLQAHSAFRTADLGELAVPILDTRGVLRGANVTTL